MWFQEAEQIPGSACCHHPRGRVSAHYDVTKGRFPRQTCTHKWSRQLCFFCLIYLSTQRHTLLLVTAGQANTGLLIALVHKYQVSAGKNLTPCAK